MTPYIYRASRTGSIQPTAALSDLYIDTYMEDQAGRGSSRSLQPQLRRFLDLLEREE